LKSDSIFSSVRDEQLLALDSLNDAEINHENKGMS
jgi:hypothetical protein